jgi:hypothetical protein
MVKATLLEPKCPYCKPIRLGMVVDAQVLPDAQSVHSNGRCDGDNRSVANTLRGSWVAARNRKDTNWAPRAVLNVKHARNAGLPTG